MIRAAPLLPFPTASERDALVLEVRRLAARLVEAGVLPPATSARLVRTVTRRREATERACSELATLLLDVLVGLEDGTLHDGLHVRRLSNGHLAVHPESIASALFHAKRSSLPPREVRRLFRFGWQHLRDVVLANSERVTFGPEEDRRRAVILDIVRANEFVEKHQAAVPLGRERPRF